MDNAHLAELFTILLCIVLSAFFSASETSYNMLNRVRLKNMAADGNKRAQLTLKIAENYDNLLSTILIGNNVVNILASSLATVFFTYLLGQNGVTVATAIVTVVVLVFGEITPKELAKEFPDRYAMSVAPAMHALVTIFTPLNWIFAKWKHLLIRLCKSSEDSALTQDDLMTIVDEAQSNGGIDKRNGDLIRSAIEFNDFDAGDILTPRVDIIAVEQETVLDDITNIFMHSRFSRIPVYKDSIDNITGMIHEKDFFCGLHSGMTSIQNIIQKIIYVGPGVHISDLLHELQQSQTQMAVVVDEFGGTEGIVTMEDIIEELVGEIWDEHDQAIDYFQKLDELHYKVNCSANLDDFFSFFHIHLDPEDFDYVTVSGWVMEQLGKIPSPGDTFTYEDYTVKVVKTATRHAVQIIVQCKHSLSKACES